MEHEMTEAKTWIGVDVAKRAIDIWDGSSASQVSNDEAALAGRPGKGLASGSTAGPTARA